MVCGPTYIGGQGGVHIVVTGAQLCQDLVESDHLIVAGVGVLQVLGLPGLVLLLHLLHLGHRVAHKGLLQVVLRVVHEVVEALHAQADTQAEKGRDGENFNISYLDCPEMKQDIILFPIPTPYPYSQPLFPFCIPKPLFLIPFLIPKPLFLLPILYSYFLPSNPFPHYFSLVMHTCTSEP